jgi:surfeit locus 1 family protein
VTSEPAAVRPRFPLGLTLAALVGFAICCALGVWQLQRAQWKAHVLVQIDAAKTAPPVSIATALKLASDGADVTYRRVAGVCLPNTPLPADTRITTDNGEWVTRAISFCRAPGGRYQGVYVDRGFVNASRGSTAVAQVVLPAPVNVTGVLAHMKGDCFGSDGCTFRFGVLGEVAPYVLVADGETPPAPGVTPAPYASTTDNLQYVGAYAPTWFGLAGVLVCVYAAMLWRRYRPKR